jgi:hypothetical protein
MSLCNRTDTLIGSPLYFQPHKPRGCNENIRPHNHNDKGKQQTRSCRNCGEQLPHPIECPAKGKTYNFCKKHNHCSKVCRSRFKREDFQEVKTKEAIIESSTDEEYAYTIKKKTEHDRELSLNR